jgi:hypothetical protein
MKQHRAQQMRDFARFANNDDDLLQLYKRLYFIPQFERCVLAMLGLLVKVSLNHELFEHSSK